jgi:hypothetical protein
MPYGPVIIVINGRRHVHGDEDDGKILICEGLNRGVRRGVSKGVEDGCKLPALRAATPEVAVRPF